MGTVKGNHQDTVIPPGLAPVESHDQNQQGLQKRATRGAVTLGRGTSHCQTEAWKGRHPGSTPTPLPPPSYLLPVSPMDETHRNHKARSLSDGEPMSQPPGHSKMEKGGWQIWRGKRRIVKSGDRDGQTAPEMQSRWTDPPGAPSFPSVSSSVKRGFEPQKCEFPSCA